MTLELRSGSFRVGDFLVDPQRNRVVGPKGEVSLQPKVVDVLCTLAERHGEVLSRAQLIDTVRGREFGADESLTRAISQLRKVFGDTRDEPQIIETISKRGYRMIVEPQAMAATEVRVPVRSRRPFRMRWALAGGAALTLLAAGALFMVRTDSRQMQSARTERTGIVMTIEPFAADVDFPVAGFAEELGVEVARSPLVRVRTRGSTAEPGTMQYRLRGSIRRVGSRVRVDTQLTDAATDELLWGENFDRPFDPQFSERGSIINTVSSETLLPLLRSAKAKIGQRPLLSLAPWELTLLVTWVPGSEGRLPPGPPSEESYWLQRRALELDADFAPAHALFAELASYHALFDPPSDTSAARNRAWGHAERAFDLSPYDGEVLYQLSLYHRFAGSRERAASTLDRVLEIQPNHPLARIDRWFVAGQCQNGSAEAVDELGRVVKSLPPSSPARWVALAHLSELHLGRGEFVKAREAALKSRKIVHMIWTAMTLAAADAELGNADEALAVLAEERREWPNFRVDYFADRVVPRWCLGGARTSKVQMIFRKLAAISSRKN